ncbi:hypothetical protein SAMN04487776_13019 [Priestia megaterium]|nr:hypothetical protein SAMN04487776_13019 [Priestia megaterium]
MTGNLSRAVLRGAGARESACLPDLTRNKCFIQSKKQHNSYFFVSNLLDSIHNL